MPLTVTELSKERDRLYAEMDAEVEAACSKVRAEIEERYEPRLDWLAAGLELLGKPTKTYTVPNLDDEPPGHAPAQKARATSQMSQARSEPSAETPAASEPSRRPAAERGKVITRILAFAEEAGERGFSGKELENVLKLTPAVRTGKLQQLVQAGSLEAQGATKLRRYYLAGKAPTDPTDSAAEADRRAATSERLERIRENGKRMQAVKKERTTSSEQRDRELDREGVGHPLTASENGDGSTLQGRILTRLFDKPHREAEIQSMLPGDDPVKIRRALSDMLREGDIRCHRKGGNLVYEAVTP